MSLSQTSIRFNCAKKFSGLIKAVSGFLSFFLIMVVIFDLTFASLGPMLSGYLSGFLDTCVIKVDDGLSRLSMILTASHADPSFSKIFTTIHALIVYGICPGVSGVLSFVPTIAVLFFCLAVMNETGYMRCIARLLDGPFRAIGLTGASAVPMLMGFGCSVPAILATESLSSLRDRYITMLLIPFMSCSAKLPIYGMLASVFFPERVMAIVCGIYLLGILIAVMCSLFLNRFIGGRFLRISDEVLCSHNKKSGLKTSAPFPCRSGTFSFRLSNLFMNTDAAAKRIARSVFSASFGFVKKAFSVILIASVIIWFLENFTLHFDTINYPSDGPWLTLKHTSYPDDSLLAELGKFISPVFAPLGFDDWRAAAALITGLSAKEAVVSTFAILAENRKGADLCMACTSDNSLNIMLCEIFSPASAFSFMVFCLLYVPCVATLATIRKQTGSLKFSLGVLVGQTTLAWAVAFVVYSLTTNQ